MDGRIARARHIVKNKLWDSGFMKGVLSQAFPLAPAVPGARAPGALAGTQGRCGQPGRPPGNPGRGTLPPVSGNGSTVRPPERPKLEVCLCLFDAGFTLESILIAMP